MSERKKAAPPANRLTRDSSLPTTRDAGSNQPTTARESLAKNDHNNMLPEHLYCSYTPESCSVENVKSVSWISPSGQ